MLVQSKITLQHLHNNDGLYSTPILNVSQMGKAPKKHSVADKVRKVKTCAEIKNNPFEVKINRKKFDVLGRKSKHDVGLPGVSRSKAINKVRLQE